MILKTMQLKCSHKLQNINITDHNDELLKRAIYKYKNHTSQIICVKKMFFLLCVVCVACVVSLCIR